MTDADQIDALKEWNRLAQENTENAIVSSMFEASSNAVGPIESFATWLLVGAATVASFLLGNAGKLVPIIGSAGFRACGLLLCVSCLFGVLSKLFALLGRVGFATGNAVKESVLQHLKAHEVTEAQIQERAQQLGVAIETGIRMDRVLSEFQRPLPWWACWAVARNLKKYAGDPQIGQIPRIKNLNAQGVFTFLQALSFLLFLATGFVSATAI